MVILFIIFNFYFFVYLHDQSPFSETSISVDFDSRVRYIFLRDDYYFVFIFIQKPLSIMRCTHIEWYGVVMVILFPPPHIIFVSFVPIVYVFFSKEPKKASIFSIHDRGVFNELRELSKIKTTKRA